MALSEVKAGRQVEVRQITGSEKVQRFLFSLGCHEGEQITLISVLAGTYIISIKDSRYAIDRKLAQAIQLIS